jgi:phage terminase small subunit
MSVKRLNNKQVEIITDKYEIYVEREKHGFILDYFKSNIKDHNAAHQESSSIDDFTELLNDLSQLGVTPEDLSELKRLWKIN